MSHPRSSSTVLITAFRLGLIHREDVVVRWRLCTLVYNVRLFVVLVRFIQECNCGNVTPH